MNFWSKRSARVRYSEEWFAALYPKLPLAGPTENGPCKGPDEAFLRQLASRAHKPSPLDPRVAHVAGCVQCMQRLRAFQREAEKARRGRRQSLVWAVPTVALLMVLGVGLAVYRRPASVPSAVIAQDLDLSDYGTSRGSPSSLPPLVLPRRVVTVSILLPRFSEPGPYSVSVLEAKEASARAEAAGLAVQEGARTSLIVTLDLRAAKPGRYYLSTTHGKEAAAYYYPLQIIR